MLTDMEEASRPLDQFDKGTCGF